MINRRRPGRGERDESVVVKALRFGIIPLIVIVLIIIIILTDNKSGGGEDDALSSLIVRRRRSVIQNYWRGCSELTAGRRKTRAESRPGWSW